MTDLSRRTLLALISGSLLAACSPTSSPTPSKPAPADKPAAATTSPGAATKDVPKPTGPRRRLSVATGGTGGVYFVLGGGLAKVISSKAANAEATAEVTSASIDNMKLIQDGKADVAFTLADTAYDAIEGRERFKDGKISASALSVLYSNLTQIVAVDGAGINTVADLKGKRVSVGAAGSGTEVIANRTLEAVGLSADRDITRERLTVAESASAIKDRKLDAFFWSGGLPTAAVLDLANTAGIKVKILPCDDTIPKMAAQYGPLYFKLPIPASTYPGMAGEVAVSAVANLLVVNEKMDDDLAFELTKILHENNAELATIHPEAKNIKLESATTGSPLKFHPGAIKYYREKNVWKG